MQNILSKVYHPQNPRPAHRLDALTTGVLVAARTRHFASLLQPQFEHGEVEKVYLAKVTGQPAVDQFECHVPISENSEELGARKTDPDHGLPSHTLFTVVQRNSDGTTILEVRPLTGRTNQIRVHLWHLGWPIVGDPVYLKDHKLASEAFGTEDRLCLHAYRITFNHPRTRERITFQAEPPAWNS